jgi:hypothetical protein
MDNSVAATTITAAPATTIKEAAAATVNTLAYSNFINSMKSHVTKERYVYCLNRYLKYLGYPIDRIDILLLQQPKTVESNIIKYIIWLKQDQKLAGITINLYLAAIVHFHAMNG